MSGAWSPQMPTVPKRGREEAQFVTSSAGPQLKRQARGIASRGRDGDCTRSERRSGCRAPASGGVSTPLQGVRGPLDQADRGPSRAIAGDHQGVLLRPDRREGAGGQGRYVGVCRGCGAYTQPRSGKGDAYAYCKACHPGAIERRWTRDRVLDAMRTWRARYGQLPSSYDWSATHARRRGGETLKRLAEGQWPSAAVVTDVFGDWPAARAAASRHD